MNYKEILKIKKQFGKLLKDKRIQDIILFGSFVKGKAIPKDIDVVIVSNENFSDLTKLKSNFSNFHISILSFEDFFRPTSLINTLLREGYSLKKNKSFSEIYGFRNRCLFKYELINLNPSEKVTTVNFLRGKGKEKGLVLEKEGEWISNQVFLCPVKFESLFEKFFLNKKIKFKKFYCLID